MSLFEKTTLSDYLSKACLPGRQVRYSEGIKKNDPVIQSVQKVWGVWEGRCSRGNEACEVNTRSRVSDWNAALPSSSRCGGWLTLLMTSDFCRMVVGLSWNTDTTWWRVTFTRLYSKCCKSTISPTPFFSPIEFCSCYLSLFSVFHSAITCPADWNTKHLSSTTSTVMIFSFLFPQMGIRRVLHMQVRWDRHLLSILGNVEAEKWFAVLPTASEW